MGILKTSLEMVTRYPFLTKKKMSILQLDTSRNYCQTHDSLTHLQDALVSKSKENCSPWEKHLSNWKRGLLSLVSLISQPIKPVSKMYSLTLSLKMTLVIKFD